MGQSDSRRRVVQLLNDAKAIAVTVEDHDLTYFIDMCIIHVLDALDAEIEKAESHPNPAIHHG